MIAALPPPTARAAPGFCRATAKGRPFRHQCLRVHGSRAECRDQDKVYADAALREFRFAPKLRRSGKRHTYLQSSRSQVHQQMAGMDGEPPFCVPKGGDGCETVAQHVGQLDERDIRPRLNPRQDNVRCASMRCYCMSSPCGLARVRPIARHASAQRVALAADTSKRSAAPRRPMPPSTTATDRERTSVKTRETEPVSPKGRSEGEGLRSCRNLLPKNSRPYKFSLCSG